VLQTVREFHIVWRVVSLCLSSLQWFHWQTTGLPT